MKNSHVFGLAGFRKCQNLFICVGQALLVTGLVINANAQRSGGREGDGERGPGGKSGGQATEEVATLNEIKSARFERLAQQIRFETIKNRKTYLQDLMESTKREASDPASLKKRMLVFAEKADSYIEDGAIAADFARLSVNLRAEIERLTYHPEQACYEERSGAKKRTTISTGQDVPFDPICVDFERWASELSPSVATIQKAMAANFNSPSPDIKVADYVKLTHEKLIPESASKYGIDDHTQILGLVVGLLFHDLARHLGYADENHRLAAELADAYSRFQPLVSESILPKNSKRGFYSAPPFFFQKPKQRQSRPGQILVRLEDRGPGQECKNLSVGSFLITTVPHDVSPHLQGKMACTSLSCEKKLNFGETYEISLQDFFVVDRSVKVGVNISYVRGGLFRTSEFPKDSGCSPSQIALVIMDEDWVEQGEIIGQQKGSELPSATFKIGRKVP